MACHNKKEVKCLKNLKCVKLLYYFMVLCANSSGLVIVI